MTTKGQVEVGKEDWEGQKLGTDRKKWEAPHRDQKKQQKWLQKF